jgi:hypothetical protein
MIGTDLADRRSLHLHFALAYRVGESGKDGIPNRVA